MCLLFGIYSNLLIKYYKVWSRPVSNSSIEVILIYLILCLLKLINIRSISAYKQQPTTMTKSWPSVILTYVYSLEYLSSWQVPMIMYTSLFRLHLTSSGNPTKVWHQLASQGGRLDPILKNVLRCQNVLLHHSAASILDWIVIHDCWGG